MAIDISAVYTQKAHALGAHESQFYEWLPWIAGYLDQVHLDKSKREEWLGAERNVPITPEVRTSLAKWYGPERAAKVQQAEAF